MTVLESRRVVVAGVKDKIDALCVHADRIYTGTATGNVLVHSINDDGGGDTKRAELLKKNVGRRSVEQLGVLRDVQSMVTLCDMMVSLHALPNLTPSTPLALAKDAFCFQLFNSKHTTPSSPKLTSKGVVSADDDDANTTRLIVGCRRRLVIYTWIHSQPQPTTEHPLPHSPRRIVFLDPTTLCFAYSPTDHALFSLRTMSASELTTPSPSAGVGGATGVGGGMGFGSLTGYMTLGMGSKMKPVVCGVGEGDVLVVKENEGYPINPEGKSSGSPIVWSAPPEEIVHIKPYTVTILPPGAIPPPTTNRGSTTGATTSPTPSLTYSIQIRSSISPLPAQSVAYPFTEDTPNNGESATTSMTTTTTATTAPPAQATLRLLTSSSFSSNPASQSSESASPRPNPVFLLSTPTDRTTATAEGSSIWEFTFLPWSEQIDQLVSAGEYGDALTLLESLDSSIIPDKDTRLTSIRALNAVTQFQTGKYEEALKTFIELDINPAKVVALYPASIAGRLAVPREGWIALFGGGSAEAGIQGEEEGGGSGTPSASEAGGEGEGDGQEQGQADQADDQAQIQDQATPDESSSAQTEPASLVGRLGTLSTLGAFIPTRASRLMREDAAETTSIRSTQSRERERAPAPGTPPHGGSGNGTGTTSGTAQDSKRSLEALLHFLPDRRAKLGTLLSTQHNITPSLSHAYPPLSSTPATELFLLPNAPFSSLTPEQLLRCAQVVDTALFKAYLSVRPGLVGALCRRYNWCDVGEVEGVLRGREKYLELIDLYHGKRMHEKALALLRELSDREPDPRDKVSPTIAYLQKLSTSSGAGDDDEEPGRDTAAEHLDQIFDAARWVLDVDSEAGLEIFTSEEVDLPPSRVTDFLDSYSKLLCARYIEFLIAERGEMGGVFHDKLAGLYLGMTVDARRRGDEDEQKAYYEKLLRFIDESGPLNVDRLYGQLSSHDLYEARAMLLGRLGRHDQALELYVYRLQDYVKAEEYCKRMYEPTGPTSHIYITLLRTYLQPSSSSTSSTKSDLLQPALDLIAKHSPRLDSLEALQLIPPLVTVREVRSFLREALHAPVFDARVRREISKAHKERMERRLMVLQERRVRVVDSRICPNCHKRIGNNSVIAVHSPRGEVTHYQCREAFSAKLKR